MMECPVLVFKVDAEYCSGNGYVAVDRFADVAPSKNRGTVDVPLAADTTTTEMPIFRRSGSAVEMSKEKAYS